MTGPSDLPFLRDGLDIESVRSLLDLLPCGAAVVRDGHLLAANGRLSDLLATERADLEAFLARPGVVIDEEGGPLSETVDSDEIRTRVVGIRHPDSGATTWLATAAHTVSVEGATVQVVVSVDITDQRHQQARLQQESLTDALTGLYNRRGVMAAVAKLADGGSGAPGFVQFVDCDDFKQINDRYGHNVGDHVLRVASQRLERMCRADDVLARWGGDEFLVIRSDVEDQQVLAHLDERLRLGLSGDVSLGGVVVPFEVSVGSVFGQVSERNLADLIQVADAAMLDRKRQRRRGRTGPSSDAPTGSAHPQRGL